MSTPNPIGAQPAQSLIPSTSTVGSGIGASVAVIVVSIFHMRGIDFPAGFEAAIAGLITVIAGYIPNSGRKQP